MVQSISNIRNVTFMFQKTFKNVNKIDKIQMDYKISIYLFEMKKR